MSGVEMLALAEGLASLTLKIPSLIPAVRTIIKDIEEFISGSDDTNEELIARIQAARKKVEAVD